MTSTLESYFVASAGVLFWTYQDGKDARLRQQMKWVTRGVALGVLPYFLLQSLPRAAGSHSGYVGSMLRFSL